MTKGMILHHVATSFLISFVCLLIALTGCHESNSGWGERLLNINDPIESFSITCGTKIFVLKDPIILHQLRSELVANDVPFEILLKPDDLKWMEYCCTFSSGEKLIYSGAAYVVEGSVYLDVCYPEELGFDGDRNIVVCLDRAFPEKELRLLKEEIEKKKGRVAENKTDALKIEVKASEGGNRGREGSGGHAP